MVSQEPVVSSLGQELHRSKDTGVMAWEEIDDEDKFTSYLRRPTQRM
jgi:hypothetical protein